MLRLCCRNWRDRCDKYILPTAFVFLLLLVVILLYVVIYRRTETCQLGNGLVRFSDINGPIKKTQARAAGDDQATASKAAPSALTWSKYQISRTASFSIPYLNFRTLIYEKDQSATGSAPESDVYYFAPSIILNSTSANLTYNWFEQQYAVYFSVRMYNKEYTEHIKKKISDRMDKPVKQLRIMPIEEIRLSGSAANWDSEFEIDNNWRPYTTQSDTVEFRIFCATGWKCQRLKESIGNHSLELIMDLEVYYTLESQRSAARRLTLTAEHIQTGKMFTELEQKFKGAEEVYLNAEDAKQMQQEIASNVMAAEITDEEFVSGENSPTLLKFIEQALQMQETSSASFTPKMWQSVYWKDENARPDKITREYQDAFDKQDQETQQRIMDYFKQQQSQKNCGSGSAGIEGAGSVKVEACTDKASSASNRDEMENYLRNINEGRKVTEMKGQRFIPKELSLKRTNLATLKQTTNFGSISVRISKILGVMKTNINLVNDLPEADTTYGAANEANEVAAVKKPPSDIRETFHVRALRSHVKYRKDEATEICRTLYNSSLATLSNMREALIHGADWCAIGHVVEDRTAAYPATSCHRKGATDARSYRSDICFRDVEEVDSYVGIEFGSAYHEEQFGFNCYGIKPLGSASKFYGGNEMRLLPFNTISYGQYGQTIQ